MSSDRFSCCYALHSDLMMHGWHDKYTTVQVCICISWVTSARPRDLLFHVDHVFQGK